MNNKRVLQLHICYALFILLNINPFLIIDIFINQVNTFYLTLMHMNIYEQIYMYIACISERVS